MSKLTLLLIPLIFLSSCTIDWNDEKEAKIAELEMQVQELKEKNEDELFKKKQDCQKQYNNRYGDPNRMVYNELTTDIFFSNKANSCILRLQGWNIKDNKRVYLIADILSERTLYSFAVDEQWNIVSRNSLEGALDELKCSFNDKLNELKGIKDDYFKITCTNN